MFIASPDQLIEGAVYRFPEPIEGTMIQLLFAGLLPLVRKERNIYLIGAPYDTGEVFSYDPDGQRPVDNNYGGSTINYWVDGVWDGWDPSERWFKSSNSPVLMLVAPPDPLAGAKRRLDEALKSIFG